MIINEKTIDQKATWPTIINILSMKKKTAISPEVSELNIPELVDGLLLVVSAVTFTTACVTIVAS